MSDRARTKRGAVAAGVKPRGSADRAAASHAPLPTLEDALGLLLPYQRRWVDDEARFLAGVWGRQTGKSFSTACKIAVALARDHDQMWMIAAPSERQSLEALEKVKQWLRALGVLFADYVESLRDVEEKAAAVRLANGSRCLAVPGRPDTVRGMSANVWLDEFAFFEDPDATWMAILPSIANPLRGGEKRAIITSTPNGKAGKGKRFYDICSEAPGNGWSVHWLPLGEAIAEGLPMDYRVLAGALGDPLAIAQELDAEFVDAQGQLLPGEVILRAESPEASTACGSEVFGSGRSLVMGVDVGRMSDPTVVWTAECLADVLVTREVLVLAGMSHADQLELLRTRVRACRRCCLDYTGLGIGLGDMLAREFGEYKPEAHKFGKVELCNFSATLKREIFPRLRDAMEGGRLRIPRDESLRVDLAAMQQVVTAGGFSYEAPRTREGHSDRCTAAALCVRAGSSPESCAHVGVLPAVRPGERRSRGGNSGVMANWKERLMSWVRR